MLERLKKFFTPQVVYRVVEVEKPRTHPQWNAQTKEVVSTLASHQGYITLIERFKLQRSALEGKLHREFHKDMREVDHLQSGIFWLTYVIDFLENSTNSGSKKRYVDPYEEELNAFKQLDAQIERVGM
jgi:hypothetical protein